MSTTDLLNNVVIGMIIIVTIAIGFTGVMMEFSDHYDITQTTEDISNQEVFIEVQNLTNTISNNVQETGIEDESSNSKIISVGWNSLKLVLKSPALLFTYMGTFSSIMNFNFMGVDFIGLAIGILAAMIFIVLITMIFLGRST